jgi:hypothetical protein
MPTIGAGASFKIGDATNALVEIADKLETISSASDTEEFNASTFTPSGTLATKVKGYGATERTYTLTGWWDLTIDTLFEAISGMTGRNFEYGPEGTATGKRKYSGTVNVGVWNGPGDQSPNGFIPFSIEVSVVTRTVGVF